MKTILALLSLLAGGLPAAQFTAAWNPVSNAFTYELSLIQVGGTSSYVAQTSQTQVTWTNLSGGTYRMVAFAITAQGVRSDPSTNFFVIVPDAPAGFRVIMYLQGADFPGGPWTNEVSLIQDIAPSDQKRFYRGWMDISQR